LLCGHWSLTHHDFPGLLSTNSSCKGNISCQEGYCNSNCNSDLTNCTGCRRRLSKEEQDFEDAMMMDANPQRKLKEKKNPDKLNNDCKPKLKKLAQELEANGNKCLGDPSKLECFFSVFE
jgi:hypothetical protein